MQSTECRCKGLSGFLLGLSLAFQCRSSAFCLLVAGVLFAGCASNQGPTTGASAKLDNLRAIPISGKITNSLGRPLEGVTVAFYHSQPRILGESRKVDVHEFHTDKEGNYAGTFYTRVEAPIEVLVSKPGYRGFYSSTGGGHRDWLLARSFVGYAPERLERLTGSELENELLEIVSSPSGAGSHEVRRTIFQLQDQLAPVLNALAAKKGDVRWAKHLLQIVMLETAAPLRLKPMSGRKPSPIEHPRPPEGGVEAVPIVHVNLIAAVKLAGQCLSPAARNFDHHAPVFSRSGDKALVEASVVNGPSAGQGYELVFHRREGQWILVLMLSTWIS